MRLQGTQEGLAPLKNWVKSALDRVIRIYVGEPGRQAGSQFDVFDAVVPEEWTVDRMRSFEASTAALAGNSRPVDPQPPLKDRSDGRLARVICYACHSRKRPEFRALEQNKNFLLTAHSACGIV